MPTMFFKAFAQNLTAKGGGGAPDAFAQLSSADINAKTTPQPHNTLTSVSLGDRVRICSLRGTGLEGGKGPHAHCVRKASTCEATTWPRDATRLPSVSLKGRGHIHSRFGKHDAHACAVAQGLCAQRYICAVPFAVQLQSACLFI